MSNGRPLSVRLHEKARHLEAFAPATAQDFHKIADELATLEAEPSCACGGREPIGEEGGTVYIRGSRAYAEVGSGMFRIDYPKGLKDGQRLLVLVFAAEPEEGP